MGVFVWVDGWVCYHDNSKLRGSILTKLSLQCSSERFFNLSQALTMLPSMNRAATVTSYIKLSDEVLRLILLMR